MPKAESVIWSFAGRELNFTSNNTPFYVQEEYTAERVVSTVTLLDPISTYFGDYNCTVTNSFGTDSVIIKLTAHSKFLVPTRVCIYRLTLSTISFPKLFTRPSIPYIVRALDNGCEFDVFSSKTGKRTLSAVDSEYIFIKHLATHTHTHTRHAVRSLSLSHERRFASRFFS